MFLLLLADISDYTIWILLGVIVAAGLLQSTYRAFACPDQELPLEDLPTPVKHMIQSMIPNWEISRIRVRYQAKDVPRKFYVEGERDGLPGRIEIETRSKTVEIREVEIKYDLARGSRNWILESRLSNEDIPQKVKQKLIARLEQFDSPLTRISRAGLGRLGGEEGYKIEGIAGQWKFEAKQLGSGKIREIELEAR